MNVVKFTTKTFISVDKRYSVMKNCYLMDHWEYLLILYLKFTRLIFMPRTLKCYTSITMHFQRKVFISFLQNFSSSIFLFKIFWNFTMSIFFWLWPRAICRMPLSRDPRTFWKVDQLDFLILLTWSLVWNFQI